jgi:site-specific DNA-cytosine methylase
LCGGVRPDVIWASPDCTTYSIAGIRFHRRKLADGTLMPVSEYAAQCDEINRHVIKLIEELRPQYWFIENPRGCFRKMDFVEGLPRYTITYC